MNIGHLCLVPYYEKCVLTDLQMSDFDYVNYIMLCYFSCVSDLQNLVDNPPSSSSRYE